MFGTNTLRETWNTQWGPEPVLAIYDTGARKAPITLPGLGAGEGAARRAPRTVAARRFS